MVGNLETDAYHNICSSLIVLLHAYGHQIWPRTNVQTGAEFWIVVVFIRVSYRRSTRMSDKLLDHLGAIYAPTGRYQSAGIRKLPAAADPNMYAYRPVL
jgi:hypothetical protein